MPPSIIKKMKLNLHERRRRVYANVPLAYENPKSHKSFYVPSAGTSSRSAPSSSSEKSDLSVDEKEGKEREKVKASVEDSESETEEETDEEAEEWDRHRTLNDDVNPRRVLAHPDDIEYQQGTKERRFEEKMEVTWEKGGSGLVFYTDEQFWREQGHDDSDEADDWDVDMEGYDVEGRGDLDNRAAIDMQHNEGLREGRISGSAFKKNRKRQKFGEKRRAGDFEKHTRGFGRRLMERHGWSDGSGLGSKLAGISNPVEASGNLGRSGLGYKGDQVPEFGGKKSKSHDCKASATKSGRTFHISTAYDADKSCGDEK